MNKDEIKLVRRAFWVYSCPYCNYTNERQRDVEDHISEIHGKK